MLHVLAPPLALVLLAACSGHHGRDGGTADAGGGMRDAGSGTRDASRMDSSVDAGVPFTGDAGDWIQVSLMTRSVDVCATLGAERCVTLTSDEPVVVDVRGPVSRNMLELGPEPVELCWCECTCAPGTDLGDLVITRSDGAVVRVPLGMAGDGCCETM